MQILKHLKEERGVEVSKRTLERQLTDKKTSESYGTLDYYRGKYYNDEGDALASFVERANDYTLTNGVKKKRLPKVDVAPPSKAEPEERRIYKVEINNPDEPAFPNFQVFSAQNDAEAVKEAYAICNEREGANACLNTCQHLSSPCIL